MPQAITIQLTEEQLAALEKVRRNDGESIEALLGTLIEEKLREQEHRPIVHRESGAGRLAYVDGTGLAVWEVTMILRVYGGDVGSTAAHLGIPTHLVERAIAYRDAYPDEVDALLVENDAMDFEALKRLLPNIQQVVLPTAAVGSDSSSRPS